MDLSVNYLTSKFGPADMRMVVARKSGGFFGKESKPDMVTSRFQRPNAHTQKSRLAAGNLLNINIKNANF
jgi:hypothetical protein